MAQLPPGFVLDGPPAAPQGGPVYGAPAKPETPDKPNLPAGYEMGPNGVARRIPGLPDPNAPGGDASGNPRKEAMQNATLDSIVGQINRVQQLYNGGVRDENWSNLFGALDNIGPQAGAFNSAGQGVADQGLNAFRTPGVGAQSDYEAKQFALANTPSAGDWDQQIEEKLSTIRRRVDANRAAVGLPPAKWEGLESGTGGNNDSPPMLASGQQPPASGGPSSPLTTPSGPQTRLAPGGSRQEDDPTLVQNGVRNAYTAMLEQSVSPAEGIAALRSLGVTNPQVLKTAAAQLAYRRKNPNKPMSVYSTAEIDDRAAPLSAFEQGTNAVMNSAAAPVGAYAINAADALTAGTMDNVTGMVGGDAARSRDNLDVISQQNPGSSLAGQMSGNVMAAALGEAGLARLGMNAGALRGVLSDTANGVAYGAGTGDNGNRGMNALLGGAYAAGGNVAGNSLAKTGNALARGVAGPKVKAVVDQGVPVTVGQAFSDSGPVGRFVKTVEDKATSLWGVGDAINARRADGFRKFNSKTFDAALSPIGAKVDGLAGEEAVQVAQAKVQQAFSDALAGKSVVPDANFANEITGAVTQVLGLNRVGPEVGEGVKEILTSHMTGNNVSGETMQMVSRELRELKAGYKNDPMGHRIGKAIDAVEQSVFGMFKRQAPEVLPAYNKAKDAYRRVSIVADAINRAKNQEDKIFTPAQLGMADRANTVKYNGAMAAAKGESPFNDIAASAQAVLPSKYPDSGTAGRLALVGSGIAAGGAASGYAAGDTQSGAMTGLGLAAILAGAYSKAGQRVLTKPARGMSGRAGRILKDDRTRAAIARGASASGVALLPETGPGQ